MITLNELVYQPSQMVLQRILSGEEMEEVYVDKDFKSTVVDDWICELSLSVRDLGAYIPGWNHKRCRCHCHD